MFELDPFWYTFHDPFLTTLVIGLAIGIPCYLLYLCIIWGILTYKKRKRFQSAAYNAVNIKSNKVINDVENDGNNGNKVINDVENDGNNGNNENFDMNAGEEVQEDLVESTFFVNDIRTIQRLREEEEIAEFGPQINDIVPFNPIIPNHTEGCFELNVLGT